MVVSTETINNHFKKWSSNKNQNSYWWHRLCFHAADVTVIPAILRSGKIIPRKNQDTIIHDAALQGALWNNPEAHNYSRFYFRPKTLFHVITEGIRCLEDENRPERQMSIPIILCFDIQNILRMENMMLTKQNFARSNTDTGSDDEFFNQINFEDVYHDKPTNDRLVRDKRMAEIVVKGELLLENNLKHIICRTVYDKITLLSILSDSEKEKFRELIKIEKIPETTFIRQFALFVSSLRFYNQSLFIKLKHPEHSQKFYKIKILQKNEGAIITEKNLFIPRKSEEHEIQYFKNCSNSFWEIYIEDVLAFKGEIPSEKSQIV